jgi:hypothetical protein
MADNVMEQAWSPMHSSASEAGVELCVAGGQQIYVRPAGSLQSVVASVVRNSMQLAHHVSVSSLGPPEFLKPGGFQDNILSTPYNCSSQPAVNIDWPQRSNAGASAAAAIAKAAASADSSFITPMQQQPSSNSWARALLHSSPNDNSPTSPVQKDNSSSWQHVLQWYHSQESSNGANDSPWTIEAEPQPASVENSR